MPERLECAVLQKKRYINTLTFYVYLYTSIFVLAHCTTININDTSLLLVVFQFCSV